MKIRLFISLTLLLSLVIGCSVPVTQSSLPVGNLDNKIIYALPKGMIRLAFSHDKDNQDVFFLEPIYVPDPMHYYALEACSNIAYDDEVLVSVDSNGLLKTINVTTTSRVGEIALQLVDLAKQAAKVATLHAAEKKYFDISLDLDQFPEENIRLEYDSMSINELNDAIDVDKSLKNEYEKEYKNAKNKADKDRLTALITAKEKDISSKEEKIKQLKNNLNNNKKLGEFRKRYKRYGLTYASLTWLANNIQGGAAATSTDQTSPGTSHSLRSVYYRPLFPCKLKVIFNDNLYEKILYLPKPGSPILAWDLKRPAFVQKISKLTFTNGVLTEVYLNKPSELLAGLKIPSEILKAVAGLPLELLQFKVSQDKAYNDFLQAQINQIQLKQQLLELQQGGK